MNKNNVKTKCINGELQIGDLVLSTPEDEYSCLVGRVTDIKLLSDPDRDTENDTDDVYVDFSESGYSEARVAEIKEMFTELYDEPKTMDDIPLDMAIIAPMCLIRITDLDKAQINAFLDKGLIAAEYCYNVLRKHPIIETSAGAIDAIIHVPYVSVWDGTSYIDTFAMLNLNTGEVTDVETIEVSNRLGSCEREYIIIANIDADVVIDETDGSRWITLTEEIVAAGSGGVLT